MSSVIEVLGASTEMVKAALFVGFFLMCAAAIYWNNIEGSNQVFIRVFFIIIIFAGIFGVYSWPIFSWHLYPQQEDTSVTYYQQLVVTEGGEEMVYDARAVKPALATPLKRDAKQFATSYSKDQQRIYGCFLLREANEELDKRKSDAGWGISSLRFPPHQFGYKWSDEDIESTERFVQIRTYRVDATVNESGTEVTATEREFQVEVRGKTCS
jgi:hypothetical protein